MRPSRLRRKPDEERGRNKTGWRESREQKKRGKGAGDIGTKRISSSGSIQWNEGTKIGVRWAQRLYKNVYNMEHDTMRTSHANHWNALPKSHVALVLRMQGIAISTYHFYYSGVVHISTSTFAIILVYPLPWCS